MTDDESLEQPHNGRIVQTRTVYAVSDSSAGDATTQKPVDHAPRAAGPDTPSFRPPVTDGPGMMADAQPAPYWQPRHDKCQSGCDVHCRGGSPCGSSTGCALLKDAQPTHKRVFDYDGSFRCLDCGAQWGALPGNPVEPTECVILSAQPTLRTDLFFSMLLHTNPSAVPEDEEPLHLFCGGFESKLAQKEAELGAERTAREQDNNWSANENSQLGEELANAKQRLAAVEVALAICKQAIAEMNHAHFKPNWFTKGEQGACAQFILWRDKATEALAALAGKKKGGS